MSWLQNKPQAGDTVQYFSIGQNKTLLLVGLGNRGNEYDGTRHNIGFAAVDAYVDTTSEMSNWVEKKDLKALVSSGRLGQNQVIAIKPTTFMNSSGEAVQAVANFYKIAPSNIIVIHDELDVDFGQIRLREGGSAAGHNGIKSVSQQIGEDYGRIRIGIGPKKPAQIDSADFVLQRFSSDEQAQMSNLTRETTAVITEFIYGGQLPHETRNFII